MREIQNVVRLQLLAIPSRAPGGIR
jgi:hypothetical protein